LNTLAKQAAIFSRERIFFPHLSGQISHETGLEVPSEIEQ
jgi:hypothetical protein